jgi:hypothetical protein
MGQRTVKRVPLDFEWPLNKVWAGYLLPDTLRLPTCADCGGSGEGPEARAISGTFYPHMIGGPNADALAWHDKLGQDEVDNLQANGRLRTWRGGEWVSEPRTAAEVNEANRRVGIGSHDAVNRWILTRFRCERLGIRLECPRCEGHGDVGTPEQRDAVERWGPTEPPEGEGWQLWETTSEGSPVSPVFATAEALADWCEPNATLFAGARSTRDEWLVMIRGDMDLASTMMLVSKV